MRRFKAVFTVFSAIVLFSFSLKAQTYNGGGGTIPDNNTNTDFMITVGGLSPSHIDTSAFGLESVCINILHTWDSDLELTLIAPDGTSVMLFSSVGGDGDNFTNTCLNGNAPTPISDGSAPFTGVFRPLGPIGNVNNQQTGNGNWKLRIRDLAAGDQGTLLGWSITFGNNPSPMFRFVSSNLPIVVINTFGVGIPDSPKISAKMGIIYNGPGARNYMTDPWNNYNGWVGIEMRGSSSQWMPKKPYGFETRDSLGTSIDVPILGMHPENDWCLIANYSDKTLMRNLMTYNLAKKLNQYATRNRSCELVLNGEYKGVYLLTEKIKRDKHRVDISKLLPADTVGDQLTGGYIIKIDKTTGSGGDGWTSPFAPAQNQNGQYIFFQYSYPDQTEIMPQQKKYIQKFIDTVETVLASAIYNDPQLGYAHYINVHSFIDYLILNEISKNVDGYRLSTFMYKDRNSIDGRLTIGPVWDYDLTWWNADYCGGDDYHGWAYKFGDICPGDGWQIPFWWDKLMQDTVFQNKLRCRWNTLRMGVLNTPNILHYIDSTAASLNEGQQRNFTQWPIIGTYVWPNPSPLATSYTEEVQHLKDWVMNRFSWLDDNIPGNCAEPDDPSWNDYSGVASADNTAEIFNVYPNPGKAGLFYFMLPDLQNQTASLSITDMNGKTVMSQQLTSGYEGDTKMIVLNAAPGMYLVRLITSTAIHQQRLVITQ